MGLINSNILIIDDNQQIRESLELFLGRHFSKVSSLASTANLVSVLQKQCFDVILLDMNLSVGKYSGNEGLFWLKEILTRDSKAIVILITAYGKVELAVSGIKQGAFDFVLKPWDNQKLLSTIKAGIKLRKSHKETDKPQQEHPDNVIEQEYDYVKGQSAEIKNTEEIIDKVAPTDANILILGENGTGKEVVAREIHRKSLRNKQIFMSVDLSALNENLFESELFGYVKGAFTDAKEDRAGKIEAANGGTLFLDEIGNLPMHLQSKLLTVLQTKTITRIGSSESRKIDFRLICATNKPLNLFVADNLFREDLLFRINTVQIDVPALRNRKQDIPVLSNYFLNKFVVRYHKEFTISKTAMQKLKAYSWPGNIRELKHTIERAVILGNKNLLSPDDFLFTNLNEKTISDDVINLEELEKIAIQKAIKKSKGNMSKAAEFLGVSRTTLYSKLSKYGL
ncbi:MAG: sigma-54 dependent transcriptional regulator [Bacteroidales bacterium]|nr:sigma-54 dependent transcriptional regulator [Bacteroidales bacterium]